MRLLPVAEGENGKNARETGFIGTMTKTFPGWI